MPVYQYKGRDNSGKLVEGVMLADSQDAVAAKLKQTGLLPVLIAPTKGEPPFSNLLKRFQTVKFSEFNVFTRQLYTLQRAGLPILTSLRSLKEQSTSQILKDTIEKISKDIEAGSTLSSALEKHPSIFNAIYVNMVKSGEVSGRLPEILERLATLGEHEEKIRMRIQAAMRYPLIVVIALIVGFLILVTAVMPRFAAVYSKHATALPLPTQILIGINFAVSKFWWLMVLSAAAFVFICQKTFKAEKNLLWLDNMKLKIPVFGPLLLKLIMSRFCRIMATLLKSGVPVLQILDLVADGIGNSVVSRAVNKIKVSVNEGKGMSEPMKNSGLFPPVVVQMVSVGESSGKIDELLFHVADYYDSEIDHTINNLVTLVEPALIVILGCVVLFMALGIFLPMWNLMNLFRK